MRQQIHTLPKQTGKFQSTHPLRGATKGGLGAILVIAISIHAPLAGCDHGLHHHRARRRHFNPRTPCGVRRPQRRERRAAKNISIHAPLAGCDARVRERQGWEKDFNPRTPCGVRPKRSTRSRRRSSISIHAPPAGSYLRIHGRRRRVRDFNPRTPCGVRPRHTWTATTRAGFQSTHPLRGATNTTVTSGGTDVISIHAPLAGCDRTTACRSNSSPTFQSTHPLRGATFAVGPGKTDRKISIHAPLAGCDNSRKSTILYTTPISIHAPLAGCDVLVDKTIPRRAGNFNPRTPCGVRPIPP